MKNKMFIGIFFVFLLSLICLNFASAYDVDVSLQKYSPYPVTPGETFDMEFKIYNNGNEPVDKITLNIADDYPFRVVSDEVNVRNLSAGESEIAEFTVYVEGDALEDEYDIELEYKINDDKESEDFEIKIMPKDVFVNIESVSAFPEKSIPGQSTEIKILIKNDAKSNVRDVIIKINLSDLPFALMNDVSEKKIDSIAYQEHKEISFNLNVLSDAEIKTYKIPVHISYYDSFGNNVARAELISLDVFSEPSMEISVKKSELIENTESKAVIQLVNNGLSNIKFLEIRFINLGNYEITGTDYYYIGDLDSDDYETLEVNIIPKQKNIELVMDLSYRDINNKIYNEQITLKPQVYDVKEAKKIGLIKTSYVGTVFFAIIILVVIFFVYRKIRKKRKNV